MLLTLIVLLPLFLTSCRTFSNVKEPSSGVPEVVGSYSKGCVGGAQMLPVNGYGYQVMRLERHRYFGHPTLIAYIQELAADVKNQLDGQLLVGDLAQPRGGKMSSGHASHQVGLDADIWFWHPSDQHIMDTKERRDTSATSLIKDPVKMTINEKTWNSFTPTYVEDLLQRAASDERVDRIFVNPGIKKKLCATHKNEAWLRKIRPWSGHDYHFHVRLRCPLGSPECVGQGPVSDTEDTCGKDLNYWFAAKKPSGPTIPTGPQPPSWIPARCYGILLED
ncbi:MAG: peptidase penicillin-insensitive murein endopeptidase [Rickettsiales bacterium]|nr:peptidase penicillin-insensitive murein endopeptidase [Rickettsiales bacterium]